MENPIEQSIELLASKYAKALKQKLEEREVAMEGDNISHLLLYKVLGVTESEGKLIDLYQNKGRFLYKYAGTFLEEATKLCFQYKYPESQRQLVPNTQSNRPKTFEIDCLIGDKAFEIKWRDATTDGDHITKEHNRVKAIQVAGYIPIRIMYYYPNREQAKRIQATLATLYKGVNGEYYSGEAAWEYVKNFTGIDLELIIINIAGKMRA
jgi:hypothetical protein